MNKLAITIFLGGGIPADELQHEKVKKLFCKIYNVDDVIIIYENSFYGISITDLETNTTVAIGG